MFEKLESLKDRYEELTEAMGQPEVIADYSRMQEILKERSGLEEIVTAYGEYLELQRHLEEARELMSDPDLAAEAREEAARLEERKEPMLEGLKMMLVPSDPLDSRNVMMEIRAGVGGEEAALFAGDLMRMYLKYCDRGGLKASILSLSDTELGGVTEALLMITGQEAFARMKFESGVHCVKRVPVTESGGRIHTSTASVVVFPEAEESELVIRPEEIRVDVFHASGHGGQGVNTTDSAVRMTHLPTGLVVSCQDERSQLQNKAKALEVLRSRLLDRQREEARSAMDADRKGQIAGGDRSQRIRTYYYNHDYVVDHRLGLTVPRVQNTMNGDLEPFISALRLAEKTEKLQSLHE
ncbi:MAG: peptide chain release factor 1 [Clostridiales bacterium]|nr:peptide chain release factor 1 [Clostridiales bacterium]